MTTIRVNDFMDTLHQGNCTQAVAAALKECSKVEQPVLTFDPGSYHFKAEGTFEKYYAISNNDSGYKNIVFPLINMCNLTIDGNYSDFIFHGRIMPFAIDQSKDITIKNMTLDCERPFYTQGTIEHAESGYADIRIDLDKYPYKVVNGYIVFYAETWESDEVDMMLEIDANTKAPKLGCKDQPLKQAIRAKQLNPELVRLYVDFRKIPERGSLLMIKHEVRLNPSIFIMESEQIVLDSISIYHTGAMGVIGQLSKDIHLNRIQVRPTPNTDRIVSANADATHFVNCSGDLLMENCLFEHQMDDATNIHGNFLRVHQMVNDRCFHAKTVHHKHHGIYIFKAGDRVRFVHHRSLYEIGEASVKEVTNLNEHEIMIELNERIPPGVSLEDGIENITAVPNVVIRNCRAGKNRARGFIIKTPGKVMIENNDLYTEGTAIKMIFDVFFWHEAGGVRDVTIRNNRLRSLNVGGVYGRSIIDIDPKIIDFQTDKGYSHYNVKIENNTLETVYKHILHAHAVKNLTFLNNKINVIPSKLDINESLKITLYACENVNLSGNEIQSNGAEVQVEWDENTCKAIDIQENL